MSFSTLPSWIGENVMIDFGIKDLRAAFRETMGQWAVTSFDWLIFLGCGGWLARTFWDNVLGPFVQRAAEFITRPELATGWNALTSLGFVFLVVLVAWNAFRAFDLRWRLRQAEEATGKAETILKDAEGVREQAGELISEARKIHTKVGKRS